MRICHKVYAYGMLMINIENLLMLKIEQLFVDRTRIDWLGSPYYGIMLEYCHNVKLAAD